MSRGSCPRRTRFDVDGQREEIGTITGALAPVAVTRTTVSPIRAVIEPPASGANLPTSKVASLPSPRERAGDGSGFGHVLSFLETNTRLPVPSQNPDLRRTRLSGTPTRRVTRSETHD